MIPPEGLDKTTLDIVEGRTANSWWQDQIAPEDRVIKSQGLAALIEALPAEDLLLILIAMNRQNREAKEAKHDIEQSRIPDTERG